MNLTISAGEPIVIAHRGAHGSDRPQNSLVAIARAIEIGAPGVEFDVAGLQDGTLVVAHDNSIPYQGRDASLATLCSRKLERELNTGELTRVEPTLELLRDAHALVCLDWKGAGEERRIGRLLESFGLVDRTIVCSTDPAVVWNLKQHYPRVAVGLSFGGGPRAIGGTTGLSDAIVGVIAACRADAAMLHHRLASPDLLAALRRRGIGIFLWTADDRRKFETLWSRSPDGVMSDAIEEHLSICRGRTPSVSTWSETPAQPQ
jgi:glycerophosphoryl diester phosphodiesterase